MDCYDCPPGIPAVAVCRLCGKGVCREHVRCLERAVFEHVPSGMAAQVRATGRSIPRMLCRACADGVGTGDVMDRIEIYR